MPPSRFGDTLDFAASIWVMRLRRALAVRAIRANLVGILIAAVSDIDFAGTLVADAEHQHRVRLKDTARLHMLFADDLLLDLGRLFLGFDAASR